MKNGRKYITESSYSPVHISPGWVISSVKLRVPADASMISLTASTLKARSPVAKGETNPDSMGSGILYGDMNYIWQYVFFGSVSENFNNILLTAENGYKLSQSPFQSCISS